jgi:hypothetical protein
MSRYQNVTASNSEIFFLVGCRVSDPDRIQFQSGQRIRIRIRIRNPDPEPEEQTRPTKIEKTKKFYGLKCWMFSFEG